MTSGRRDLHNDLDCECCRIRAHAHMQAVSNPSSAHKAEVSSSWFKVCKCSDIRKDWEQSNCPVCSTQLPVATIHHEDSMSVICSGMELGAFFGTKPCCSSCLTKRPCITHQLGPCLPATNRARHDRHHSGCLTRSFRLKCRLEPGGVLLRSIELCQPAVSLQPRTRSVVAA